MDQYSSKIALYEECSRLLSELDAKNEVTIGLVASISNSPQYTEKVIEELISIGAARRGDSDNLCCTALTHSLNVRGYYQERISELKRQREKEELNRRSVESAEESAKAAQCSAQSAKRANWLSATAIVLSLISLIISLVLRIK